MMNYFCRECGKTYNEEQAESVDMECCSTPLDTDSDYPDYEEDEDYYDEDDDDDDYDDYNDIERDCRELDELEREQQKRFREGKPLRAIGCKCAIETDEYHGWECDVTGGACMYMSPNSKACAKDFGEGPDVKRNENNDIEEHLDGIDESEFEDDDEDIFADSEGYDFDIFDEECEEDEEPSFEDLINKILK